MLRYNFEPIFKLRKVERPYSFLRKIGLTHYKAHKIVNNKLNCIPLNDLEKICLSLNCNVHDLIEWEPGEKIEEPDKQALAVLNREQNNINWEKLIADVPVGLVSEVEDVVRNKIKNNVE